MATVSRVDGLIASGKAKTVEPNIKEYKHHEKPNTRNNKEKLQAEEVAA